MRAGALTTDRLDVAAWLGHPAAAKATGLELDPATGLPLDVREERAGRTTKADLTRWASRIGRGWDGEVRCRAALAVGAHHLAELRRDATRAPGEVLRLLDDPRDRLAWELWDAAATWTSSGREQARRRLTAVLTGVHPGQLHHQAVHKAAVFVAAVAAGKLRPNWWPRPAQLNEPLQWMEADLRAVREHVVPWALGLRDPLARLPVVSLDALEVASPCPRVWSQLAPTADPSVRRCDECALDVIDLSALARAEAEALLRASAGGRCVRFYRDGDGAVLTGDCLVGLRGRAAPRQAVMGLFLGDPQGGDD